MTSAYSHRDLLADVRAICRKGGDNRAVAQQVDSCLKKALQNRALLDQWEGYDAAKAFHVLYTDPDFGFYITSSTLEPGYFRMPHDHGPIGWNIYGTYRNQFVQRLYRRIDNGSKDGFALLEVTGEHAFGEGETYTFFVDDIHRDLNLASGPSISIVVRQQDPRGIVRNVFHPEKNAVKAVKAGNLLLRSKAEYDAFFADVLQPAV